MHARLPPLANVPQEGDAEAAEAVLQHAWAALDVGRHKQDRSGVPPFLRRFNAGWSVRLPAWC